MKLFIKDNNSKDAKMLKEKKDVFFNFFCGNCMKKESFFRHKNLHFNKTKSFSLVDLDLISF